MDCRLCGAKNINRSMGGPDICSYCDCYPLAESKVRQENARLQMQHSLAVGFLAKYQSDLIEKIEKMNAETVNNPDRKNTLFDVLALLKTDGKAKAYRDEEENERET